MTGEELDYLIRKLMDQPITNQVVINYQGKMSKLQNLDYYPDADGHITYQALTDWSIQGYSVSEMLECLKRYREKIHSVDFQAYDGSVQEMINIYESEFYSSHGEYSCVIIVGEDKPFDMPGKISDDKIGWATDLLYPDRFRRY